MIIALVLFGYAATVGVSTGLLRRGWVSRAPRLAIALWQLATCTIVLATVLGFLVLTVPVAAGSGLAGLLHACVMALRASYRTPTSERLVFLAGIGFAATLVIRMAACLAHELWRAARERRRHVDALTLLGQAEHLLGVTILDHPSPTAYCVPGRRRRIVLTTATLAALDDDQLAGVLAHERTHLTGRHDLVLALARALARAFPLPVFQTAVAELPALVEMLADDAARGPEQRLTLATALVNLATGQDLAPAAALAAASAGVLARVRRLSQPLRPLPRVITAMVGVGAIVVAAAPLAIAVAPAAVASALPYCPLSGG